MASPGTQSDTIRFGPFELDRVNLELRKRGYVVKLQPQPFAVLQLMIESAGRVVSRDEIRRSIWKDDTFVDFERGINFAISQIREALGDDHAKPRFVETIPRRGYRFLCATQVGSGGAPVAATLDRNRFRSLAVLPFTNGTGPEEAEYLSEGISESIINLLSQFPDLRVVPRTSAFRYKGVERELKEIAHDLRVDAILTGAVTHRGDRLIVQTELVDVKSDAQIWGSQFNRKFDDIFELQEELARNICECLRPRLTPDESKLLNKRPTKSREAYLLYLKAMYHANKWSADGIEKGITYSKRAIETDPLFAEAYAGLAYLYFLAAVFGGLPPRQMIPLAKAITLKALEIDETLATAHACMAHILLVYDWDWAGVERESRRAIELAPNHPGGHHVLSQWLLFSGRSEEAIAEARKTLELDPLSLPSHQNLATTLYMLGEYDAAIEQLHQALELDPSFAPGRDLLALSYAFKGCYPEAVAEVDKIAALFGESIRADVRLRGPWGLVCAVVGKHPEARIVLAEMRQISEQAPEFLYAYYCAAIHALMGENDEALEWLEKARRGRVFGLYYLKLSPEFKTLHEDVRFGNLLRRIGFPE